MRGPLIAALATVVVLAGLVAAGRREQETRTIDPAGASAIELELEFGAGELQITPNDMTHAAIVDLSYDTRKVSYDIDYDTRRETGFLYIEATSRRNRDIDTDDNNLDLTLSTRYQTTIDMDMGACDADIDLGGIPLEELTIDVGAASGEIEFSQPNPIRLRELDIDAGASSLEMFQIGNANFEVMTFDGGAGSFDLDFRGTYTGESRIDIDVGLSSADIILPAGIPVRIESDDDNWFASVDFHHDNLEKVDDGIYESPDFDGAPVRITLTIDVGMGSVDVYWK